MSYETSGVVSLTSMCRCISRMPNLRNRSLIIRNRRSIGSRRHDASLGLCLFRPRRQTARRPSRRTRRVDPIHGKLEPPHQVARTNAAGRFTFTAPNGKYLLTIGSDEAYTPPPGYQTPDPLTSVWRRSRPPQHALARNSTRHDRPQRRHAASQSLSASKTGLRRQSRRPIQIHTSPGDRANKELSRHPTLKNRSRMPSRRTNPSSPTPPQPR